MFGKSYNTQTSRRDVTNAENPADMADYLKLQKQWVKKSGITMGSRVKVIATAESYSGGWACNWTSSMRTGLEGKVYFGEVGASPDGIGIVDANNISYWFPYWVLVKVEDNEDERE